MKWLVLLFFLIVLVLIFFNTHEEFESRRQRRMERRRDAMKKEIALETHLFIGIVALCFYIFNYTKFAIFILVTWPIYVAIHALIRLIFFTSNEEAFGATSPGTMVQLRTSHVLTEEDSHYWKYVYPKQVAKEIRNMTESDLR
jgi:nicotinamide riboside transporter PnuC